MVDCEATISYFHLVKADKTWNTYLAQQSDLQHTGRLGQLAVHEEWRNISIQTGFSLGATECHRMV